MHQWLSNNVPETVGADVVSVWDLIHQLLANAKTEGISSAEIEEDTGGVYEAILDAIGHHEAGVAE